MLEQAVRTSREYGLLGDDNSVSRCRTLDTAGGLLVLQDACPPSFVERLRADSGLRAFARLPEREHQLLINIARNPSCKLTLAYTPGGEIVGQVTLAPASSRWEGEEDYYEAAVEVSSSWRRRRVAQQLLAFALEWDALEKGIVLAMGFSWHWDMEGADLPVFRYREMIAQLFAAHGFAEYLTNEPNIRMDPGNIFLARFGRSVDTETVDRFFQLLLQSADTLPGR